MLTIATALIIVVIILLVIACRNMMLYEDYLYGFWVAEGDAFCEESEIESMMLFIGEWQGALSVTHECYLVIMNNLCNQSFTLSYCPLSSLQLWPAQYTITATTSFDEASIWPEHIQVTVDMQCGVLTICAEDTLYARLHKQHDITNMAKSLLGADLVEAAKPNTQ